MLPFETSFDIYISNGIATSQYKLIGEIADKANY